jgi:ribonuclease D
MVKMLAQIRYFLEQEEEQYSLYAYSNHYKYLLKDYQHKMQTFGEEEKEYQAIQQEMRRRVQEEKENNCKENFGEGWGEMEYASVKSDREKYLCELLMHWREHMARIVDCPARRLLSFHQIATIAVNRPNSILEMQDILDHQGSALDLAPKLLELLSL